MSAVLAIAEGVAAESNANTGSQLTNGLSAINLVVIYLKLQEVFSELLSQDAETIYQKSLGGGNEATGAIRGRGAAVENKNIDSAENDLRTGNLDGLIQDLKSIAQFLANAMTESFANLSPASKNALQLLVSMLSRQMGQ